MNKNYFIFGLFFIVAIGFVSAFDTFTVNTPVDLTVRVLYDNNVTLSNIPVSACLLSVYSGYYVLSNVSMIPNGQYHHYAFTPSFTGYYYASVYCSYLGDNSLYLFNFNVTGVPPPVNTTSGSGSGTGSTGGSVLQSALPSASILPDRSSYTVNLLDNSVLKFNTQYFSNSTLVNSGSATWKLLQNGNVLTTGSLLSTSTGVYAFSYDFVNVPVGQYQVALSFDGKTILVDVGVVSREQSNVLTGLVTNDDGSVSATKVGISLFVLIFIIVALVLLARTIRKKPVNHNPNPRQ